jgi:hypothetical protein
MNLFQIITIMSFFMLLPISVAVEGAPILPHKLAALVSGQCLHSVFVPSDAHCYNSMYNVPLR